VRVLVGHEAGDQVSEEQEETRIDEMIRSYCEWVFSYRVEVNFELILFWNDEEAPQP
jgi:hypothetical protein